MVCLQQECIRAVSILDAAGKMNTVNPNGEMVRTARAIGIGFGIEKQYLVPSTQYSASAFLFPSTNHQAAGNIVARPNIAFPEN